MEASDVADAEASSPEAGGNAPSSAAKDSNTLVASFAPGDACSFPERFTRIQMFSPPRQMQRWGDKQILPHINWGDLFFDLFYVAAAYNLSYIILNSPSREGVLYFVGLMGPIMWHWFLRVFFDSRFALGDDILHRAFEVLQLCFLATVVTHIRPVDVMRSSAYPDMFAYSLGMCCLVVCNILRFLEIKFFVVGEKAAKISANRDIVSQMVQCVIYLAAAIVSGTRFYGNDGYDGNEGGHRRARVASIGQDDISCSGITAMLASQCGIEHRLLAETSGYAGKSDINITDIPVWLCLGGWLWSTIFDVAMVIFLPGNGEHKKITVPMNIDYAIHRYGEWIMLLLGESILSILISETGTSLRYFITFYCAIISVVLLQYLHYRSQPHHADEHALRRNKNSGVLFFIMIQVYSIALVAVGVSYKMILYELFYEEKSNDSRRLLVWMKETASRILAGQDAPKYSLAERQGRVAHFFCGSLAVAWVCLDLMILSHNGIKASLHRCECEVTRKVSKSAIFFCVLRVALVVFIATLSQYVTDPLRITVIGMVAIIAQVCTRFIGDMVIKEPEKENSNDRKHWPNVTEARSEPGEKAETGHV
eukprot:CAMPEP_0113547210 /NCGR_PEP_ID=MMETSP0015_2-20120614/12230_1 /TAXON_ID=2838 /ORGANISM="Odontella" /LENGTH=593 /DNA_ID=CAMNT_0000447741 /DNA_START=82 /DNA_END=1863 /DNA_ORIENTATION=+ /assembly_acc=CAM_ASM_000160